MVLEREFGLEAAAGLAVEGGRWSLGLRAIELALVPGETEAGYRWQRLENGQQRCREASTGRFAPDTRCIALETAVGASAELRWLAVGGAEPLFLGAGYRAGDGHGPYATVRWRAVTGPRAALWHLEAAAGASLFRLSAGVGLGL